MYVFSVFSFILLQGCATTVPTVVYLKKINDYTAVVQIQKPADIIYETSLKVAESNPELNFITRDDVGMSFKVTDGRQNGILKVVPVSARHAQLMISADTAGGIITDRELAILVIRKICKRLVVKDYTVVEM